MNQIQDKIAEIENKTVIDDGDSGMWQAMKEDRDRKRHQRSAQTNNLIEKYGAQKEDEWTYLVFDGQKYKIGKSKDPEKRMKELRTANPTCMLLAKTKKVSEKILHVIFRHKRLSREWFYLNNDDLINIKVLFDSEFNLIENDLIQHHFRKFRNEKRSADYVISFGMHKGTKITDMTSDDQLSYLNWFVGKSHSNSDKKRNPYLAFNWWIKNYQSNDTNNPSTVIEAIDKLKDKDAKNAFFSRLNGGDSALGRDVDFVNGETLTSYLEKICPDLENRLKEKKPLSRSEKEQGLIEKINRIKAQAQTQYGFRPHAN